MKIRLSKLIGATLLFFTALSGNNLVAQCTTSAFGQYPAGTITPGGCGSNTTVTTCAFASEYSLINLTAGNTYQFAMNIATDYITIADNATNTPQVWGTTPVTFNCTTSGVYRFYRHLDAACGASSAICRVATVSRPVPANDNCASAIGIIPGVTSGSINGCSNVDAVALCGSATAPTTGGVWYSYTPGCSAQLTVSVCTGTSYNSQISVFSGTCGALSCVDGNDDFCATQSSVTWAGVSGTTYYILVHGNGAIGAFNLTLSQTDVTAPVANVDPLPALNGSCQVNVPTPVATDNCSGAVNATTSDPVSYTVPGVYSVTWTYTDFSGNSSTQTQSVTVDPDPVAPTIICQNDTTVTNDEAVCGATVDYQIPACTFPGEYYAQNDDVLLDNGLFIGNAGPWYIADDFLITDSCWNITNFNANLWEAVPNSSLSSITVRFYNDGGGVPGTIISTQTLVPANWTTSGVLGAAFGYSIQEFYFTLPTPVNLCGAPGGTTYWMSLHDNATPNSVAWSTTPIITGFNGKTAPTATGAWANALSFGAPTDVVFSIGGQFPGNVTDNCPQCPTIVQIAGLAPGSLFPVGTTTNTFRATDAAGNSSTCSFDVIVNDTEAPSPDAVLSFTFNDPAIDLDIEDLTTVVDSIQVSGLPTVLAPGNLTSVCVNITHTWDSDILMYLISPMGTTIELSTANGGSLDNYTNTCFDINATTSIVGGTAPFTGSFLPEDPAGFSAVDGEDPNGYWKISIFDQASGDEGNLSQLAITFNYADQLPPMNATCSATVTAPTATDNCDGPVTATTSDPLTYSSDGVYSVNWTYTDLAGNTFIQVQTVTVEDSIAPVADLAVLPMVSGECTATITVLPTATDNCEGTITGTTLDPITYDAAGTYTVTWTYDDGRGNSSTQTQTVVVTDTEPPVPTLTILPNVVGNCVVTIPAPPTASDNCSGELIIGTTTDPISYNLIGTFFIIWHFDDGNGNTWTQNQTVVVNPCLGIQGESGAETIVVIYPNPGNGQFTLSLSEMPIENTQVRLIDALGQVLYSGVLQGQVQQFDFSHLGSATYYLQLTNNNGHMTKPVIISKNQ